MKLVKNISSLAIISAAAMVSANAMAGQSSPAEYRGYSKCIDVAQQESNGLTPKRNYLMSKDGATFDYYINASRWESGDRVAVRIACQTGSYGRILISHSIEPGQFNQRRGEVSIEVAKR